MIGVKHSCNTEQAQGISTTYILVEKTTFITSFINVEKTRHKHPLYVVYADSMNITQTKHPYSLLIRYIQTIYGALAPNPEQNID